MPSLTSARVVMVPAADLAVGSLIGPWRVEHELGRGGMAAVYAVVHTTIGKRAALKVIHHTSLTGTFTADQILLEARAVNAITHPNIVDIFETGLLADGRPYLVMERLLGQTLGDRHDEGRIPALEIIDYLVPLCDALATAHAAGIVHRDLKPDNIFLVDAGWSQHGPAGGPTVKLLDWGIATMVSVDGALAGCDVIVGTPQYVAPELVRGLPVTTASDVYSLGVVAYELFLESLPFCAETAAEVVRMHVFDAPPIPHEVWPQIPPVLEELLLRMLAKTPALRPTMTEVAEGLIELRYTLTASRPSPPPPSAPSQPLTPVPTPVTLAPEAPVGRPVAEALASPASGRWSRNLLLGAAALAIVLGGRVVLGARASTPPPVSSPALGPVLPVAPVPAPRPAPIEEPPATAAAALEAPTTARPLAVRPRARRARATPSAATARVNAPSATRPPVSSPPASRSPRPLHPDAVIDPY